MKNSKIKQDWADKILKDCGSDFFSVKGCRQLSLKL